MTTRACGTSTLLTGPAYRRIAGNLDAWPRSALGEPRWIEFTIHGRLPPMAGEALDERRARARTFVLPGDLHLLVGRDTTELAAFRELTAETSVAALAAGTVLALGIGLLTSGASCAGWRESDGRLGPSWPEIWDGGCRSRAPATSSTGWRNSSTRCSTGSRS